MKLVTINVDAGGLPGAILSTGEVLHLRRAARPGTAEMWLPRTVRAILEAGPEGMKIVCGQVERIETTPASELDLLREQGIVTQPSHTSLLAPILEPRLVIGGGLNYRSHLKEMAGTPEPSRPTGFVKISASITGPESRIFVPPQAANMVDWEGELGCVIGRICHNISKDEALECIAGYTVVNDVSARDWVKEVFAATDPWDARQSWERNVMGKQFTGFTAVGPALVTRDEVGDASALVLETRLNGAVVQHAETSDAIFDFAESIAFFSRWYTFHPGDIITTGTPAGVGAGRKPQVFMRPGDVVEVEVTRVGLLRNTIVG